MCENIKFNQLVRNECILTNFIEPIIFAAYSDDIPNEECPICLELLSEKSETSCCAKYARKLNCGHWIHVGCQFNNNQKIYQCPICLKILYNPNKLLQKIMLYKYTSRLPIYVQMNYSKYGIKYLEEKETKKDLLKYMKQDEIDIIINNIIYWKNLFIF